jgi:hypothetical protein
MARESYTFTLKVDFDDAHDGDTIGNAVDVLLETALSTPGILDDLGNPDIGQTGLELHELLLRPDTDDATYILRQVYIKMNLPIPAFLEVAC